ncbi:MAG: hypothetical protein AABZ64_15870, partial [Nitrospinota bacterium]
DTGGFPIGGVPVQVFASPRALPPDPRLDRAGLTPLADTTTASDGTYRLSFSLRAGPLRYYLSFYAPDRFDDVQYLRPERIDMTGRVQPGGHWVFDLAIPFHGAWPQVQEVLKSHPGGSAKARVIRQNGIAEEVRIQQSIPPVEEWWYYSRGKKYSFRQDQLIEETGFAPVLK